MSYFSENTNLVGLKPSVIALPMTGIESSSVCQSRSSVDKWFRQRFLRFLAKMRQGCVTLVESDGRTELGTSATEVKNRSANVFINHSRFYRRVMLGGSIGAAESYIDGDWGTDRLTQLIQVMIRNLDHFVALEKTWGRAKSFWDLTWHRIRPNSIRGSQKNIAAHYDLSNDFYQLFLDPTLNYSSGIFLKSGLGTDETETPTTIDLMNQASHRKMARICEKLQLSSADHVLEIGSGWGGMAIYMASKFDCRVTTTTISQAQFDYATAAVKNAGLSDKITVLKQDYRQLTGQYDKLVSIEMIEAVGHQYYDCFFDQCQRLLKSDGAMLLQAITISEQNYRRHIHTVDFIRRYVFPGGCLPSLSALQGSAARKTDFRLLHSEDITPHYVATLRCWRDKFLARLPEIRCLGFDDRFIRMWHFYLCYCEAAFAERRVHSVQIVFSRPSCPIDPSVEYCLDQR